MNEFTSKVHLITLYISNASLALSYVLWENLTPIAVAIAFVMLGWHAPVPQRGWIAGVGGLAVIAAAFAMPPVPVLLAVMAGIGLLAMHLDRFHPDTSRWRVMGALALYAGAALAYLAYNYYLAGVDAAVWAEAIGGQGEAQATLAQGRAFLTTLATWSLWLILPLGYLSLL
ncbi:MAG: hypothetical protein KDD84_09000, partial [Caldilineaceae bacterium]|nr:hypothetical protein [Caldilineaceae bacterium]